LVYCYIGKGHFRNKEALMNKREIVLSLLDKERNQEYFPAAFFLHFDDRYQRGQAAIDKHLEYFRHTHMDFVKIQYENKFPIRPEISKPADWEKMPFYKKDFYQDPLNIVEDLLKKSKKEALVIMTLYSPFMCAGHTTGGRITEHIKERSEKVKKGMEIITASLMIFVKECIKLGIDGFYHSTQGGESFRFDDPSLFEEYIKPYDLILMEEIKQACILNILHVCDYHGGYNDLTPFFDYPGHLVNCSLELGGSKLTGKEISKMFRRPFMGGMDRKGVIVSGSKEEIKRSVQEILNTAPGKFILGADCTLPSETKWENIRTAISTAHDYKRE
jgi:uroporphyrinogen decarboxylase